MAEAFPLYNNGSSEKEATTGSRTTEIKHTVTKEIAVEQRVTATTTTTRELSTTLADKDRDESEDESLSVDNKSLGKTDNLAMYTHDFGKGKYHLALQKLFDKLPGQLQYPDRINARLFSKLILEKREFDNLRLILDSKGPEHHNEKLLEILMKKPERDIVIFVDILKNEQQEKLADYINDIVKGCEKEIAQCKRRRHSSTDNSTVNERAVKRLKGPDQSLDLMLRIVNQPECIKSDQTLHVGNNNHLVISVKTLKGSDKVTNFIKHKLYQLKSELMKALNIGCTCLTKDQRPDDCKTDQCGAMVSVGFESGEKLAYDMFEAKLLDFESFVFERTATGVSLIQECIKIQVQHVLDIHRLESDLEDGSLLKRLFMWLQNEGFKVTTEALVLLVDRRRLDEIKQYYGQYNKEVEVSSTNVHKDDVTDACSESSSVELNEVEESQLKQFVEDFNKEIDIDVSSSVRSNNVINKLIMAKQCDDDLCMDNSCREGKKMYGKIKDSLLALSPDCMEILGHVANHSEVCEEVHCSVPMCDFFYDYMQYGGTFVDLIQFYKDQSYKLNISEEGGLHFLPLQDDNTYHDVPIEGVDFDLISEFPKRENIFWAKQSNNINIVLKKSRCFFESCHVLERLRNMKHENIVTHLWAIIYAESDKLVVTAEYEGGQNLRNHIQTNYRDGMNVEDLLPIQQKLKQTVEFLHERDILYLNWQAENILFGTVDQLKLCNFTTAITKDSLSYNDELAVDLIMRLPPYLIAPEFYDDEIDFPKTDYWGFGALMFEIVTGNHLHWDKRHLPPDIQRDQTCSEPVPDLTSIKDERVMCFIENCLILSPVARVIKDINLGQ